MNVIASDIKVRVPISGIDKAVKEYEESVTERRIPLVRINERHQLRGIPAWPLPGAYGKPLMVNLQEQGFVVSMDPRKGISLTDFSGEPGHEFAPLLSSVMAHASHRSYASFTLENGNEFRVTRSRGQAQFTGDCSRISYI